MSAPYTYNTIAKPSQAEFRDRGSRFIAYAFPVQNAAECKEKLALLKKEHAKATHHCFAYRLGLDGTPFRVSDDGEPSGTAGRPILGQLDSRGLTQVMVVVVRYFGGTLLGVPGLIHAYKTAAALALQTTPVLQKPVEERYRLQFDYTRLNEVLHLIRQYDCTIHHQDLQLFCRLDIGIPRKNLAICLLRLGDLPQVEKTPVPAAG
ncbi:MAG TPA: YigZ family protein [Chitinophagaceae bacterium]|nr:YigZ family protein [Chitinophagaceae bacterium]